MRRGVRQTSLGAPVALSGVALHSGAAASARLHPAPADSGIVFRAGGQTIPARAAFVADTRLCTRLGAADGVSIGVVEHLLAALVIAGVDNAIIDIDGGEAPILDGSAAPYVEAIEAAGVATLAAPRREMIVTAPVEIIDGERAIRIDPFDGRRIDLSVGFDDAAIGEQQVAIDLDEPADRRRLARARTFCRLSDVEAMREAGFSLGGSLASAIVVDGARILNEGGLRDPAEFALHKALDLVGDLALAGAPIIGRITARRPGHDLNARFLRRLLDAESHAVEQGLAHAAPAARCAP